MAKSPWFVNFLNILIIFGYLYAGLPIGGGRSVIWLLLAEVLFLADVIKEYHSIGTFQKLSNITLLMLGAVNLCSIVISMVYIQL
jgi:hypothetical protein